MNNKLVVLIKKILLVLPFFVIIYGHAQMGVQKRDIDHAELLKEKPLLVILENDGSKLADGNFNDYLKNAINKIWEFSPSVKFVNQEEYQKIIKDNTKSDYYGYLDFLDSDKLGIAPANSFVIGLSNERSCAHYVTMYGDPTNYSYGDVFFYLTQLQNDLNNAVNLDFKTFKKQRNALFISIPFESIGTKTLLLDENMMTDKLKENLESIYNFNYKIVPKQTIDNAIVDKQSDIIFIRKMIIPPVPIIKSKQGSIIDGSRHDNGMLKRNPDEKRGTALSANYYNAIIDAESGKVIFICKSSFKDEDLDEKDFKYLSKTKDN